MITRSMSAKATAIVALVSGFGISAVVAVAMNHNRAQYAKYFGFAVLVALLAVTVAVYRRYVSPKPTAEAAEETTTS